MIFSIQSNVLASLNYVEAVNGWCVLYSYFDTFVCECEITIIGRLGYLEALVILILSDSTIQVVFPNFVWTFMCQ